MITVFEAPSIGSWRTEFPGDEDLRQMLACLVRGATQVLAVLDPGVERTPTSAVKIEPEYTRSGGWPMCWGLATTLPPARPGAPWASIEVVCCNEGPKDGSDTGFSVRFFDLGRGDRGLSRQLFFNKTGCSMSNEPLVRFIEGFEDNDEVRQIESAFASGLGVTLQRFNR